MNGFSRSAVGGFFAAMLLVGCNDLPAVRDFARTAASASTPDVANDYASAIERQKRIQPATQSASLDALAQQRAAQQTKFDAAQAAISAYMVTLSELAANQMPDDQNYTALGEPLKGDAFIGSGDASKNHRTAAASVDLMQILTLASRNWRQVQTGTMIQTADPTVQSILAGLDDLVSIDFQNALNAESDSLRDNVEKPLAKLQKDDPTSGAATLAKQLLADQQISLANRQARLKTSAEILRQIATGHRELAENFDRLSNSTVSDRIRKITKDLQSLQIELRRSSR